MFPEPLAVESFAEILNVATPPTPSFTVINPFEILGVNVVIVTLSFSRYFAVTV